MRSATPRKHAGERRVGRPPGPAPDPAVRREELLQASVRAIRRLGPEASMDELAAEAGITKPILYTHFGDKSGLATAIAEHFAVDLVDEVLASFTAGAEPRTAVRQAIDTFIGFVELEPHVYRFLARGVAASENTLVNQRLVIEVGLRLADVLRDQLSEAGVDTKASELWAFGVLGSVFVGAEWWLFRQTMTRDELVDRLTELAWSGLFGSATAVATTFDTNLGDTNLGDTNLGDTNLGDTNLGERTDA